MGREGFGALAPDGEWGALGDEAALARDAFGAAVDGGGEGPAVLVGGEGDGGGCERGRGERSCEGEGCVERVAGAGGVGAGGGGREEAQGGIEDETVAATRTGVEAVELEACDVLHQASAGLRRSALAQKDAHAEDVVAGGAEAQAVAAGPAVGEDAAEGGSGRAWDIGREAVAAGGDGCAEVGHGGAGVRRDGAVSGFVGDDTCEAAGREQEVGAASVDAAEARSGADGEELEVALARPVDELDEGVQALGRGHGELGLDAREAGSLGS